MKSFKGYVNEAPAWTESLSSMLFDLPRAGIKDVKIPLSPSIFRRLWPKPVRSRVFHLTDFDGVEKLGKLEGRKKSISAFYNIRPMHIDDGIRTTGGYVVEMDADVLAAAPDDISSMPDKGGTRWISLATLLNEPTDYAAGFGGQNKLKGIEDDINEMLIEIIMNYADDPKFMPNTNKAWPALGQEYKNDKQTLYMIIKDYHDGMEKVLRKYGRVLQKLFQDYTKDRHLTPDPDSGDVAEWDEIVVNNFKIIKIHVGPEFASDFDGDDDIDGYPWQGWDSAKDLSRYIAQVVKKDIKK